MPRYKLIPVESEAPAEKQGWGESGLKALGRTAEGFAEAAGSGVKMLGDLTSSPAMSRVGSTASKYWRDAQQQGVMKADPQTHSGTFLENPSFQRAYDIVVGASPWLATAMVTSAAVTSKALQTGMALDKATRLGAASGAGLLGFAESAPGYEEAREKGKSVEEATGLTITAGLGTAGLEYLPISRMMKRGGTGLVSATAKGAAEEGAQEATQTVWQNAVAKYGYDATRQLHEGIVEAMIGGAGSGGMVGAVTSRMDQMGIPKDEQIKLVEEVRAEQVQPQEPAMARQQAPVQPEPTAQMGPEPPPVEMPPEAPVEPQAPAAMEPVAPEPAPAPVAEQPNPDTIRKGIQRQIKKYQRFFRSGRDEASLANLAEKINESELQLASIEGRQPIDHVLKWHQAEAARIKAEEDEARKAAEAKAVPEDTGPDVALQEKLESAASRQIEAARVADADVIARDKETQQLEAAGLGGETGIKGVLSSKAREKQKIQSLKTAIRQNERKLKKLQRQGKNQLEQAELSSQIETAKAQLSQITSPTPTVPLPRSEALPSGEGEATKQPEPQREKFKASHRTSAKAAKKILKKGFDLNAFGTGAGAGSGEPAGIFLSRYGGEDFKNEVQKRGLPYGETIDVEVDGKVLYWDKADRFKFNNETQMDFIKQKYNLNDQDAEAVYKVKAGYLKKHPELSAIAKDFATNPKTDAEISRFQAEKLKEQGYDVVEYKEGFHGVTQTIVLNPDAIKINREGATNTKTAQEQPEGYRADEVLPSKSDAEGSARRSKPREPITFKSKITGPSGESLVGYAWRYTNEEYVDKYGEERTRRVSNWDEAEANVDTGRDVVHQFIVEGKDGKQRVVSAESALAALGYTDPLDGKKMPSLRNALKTMAKLRMEYDKEQRRLDEFKRVSAEVDGLERPKITKEETKISDDGKGRAWSRIWHMGDAMVWERGIVGDKNQNSEKIPDERRSSLIEAWKRKRIAERFEGGKYSVSDAALADLNRRIERQQKKIDRIASEFPQTPSTPGPTTPKSAKIEQGVERMREAEKADTPIKFATKDMGQRRAKAGGEFGANGEWYEGGKFIATTDRPKTRKRWKKPTGRQEYEKNTWGTPPETADNIIATSLYKRLAGIENVTADGRFAINPNLRGDYATDDAIKSRQKAIDAWNNGGRWSLVSVSDEGVRTVLDDYMDNSGNKVSATKYATKDAAQRAATKARTLVADSIKEGRTEGLAAARKYGLTYDGVQEGNPLNPQSKTSHQFTDKQTGATITVNDLVNLPREIAKINLDRARSEFQNITSEDVRGMFKWAKGARVRRTDGAIIVEVGPRILRIKNVESIAIDEAAFKVEYGRKPGEGEQAAGAYQDGEIKISKIGDRFTLAHESFHWLEDIGVINRADVRAIDKAIGKESTAEDRAKWFESAMQERGQKGRVGRAIQKIQDFIDSLVNLFHRTARGVIRDVESGAIFDQKQSGINQFAQSAKLSVKKAAQNILDNPRFVKWFGKSVVVNADGTPKVVYSGHANIELYGNKYDPKKTTAGAFYTSENPTIASNYAMSKLGMKEYFENGEQYRFKYKNGNWGRKLWQIELSEDQQNIARDFLKNEVGYDVEKYWKDNAPYDIANRRALARGGLKDLHSIWQFMEYMGENIAYPADGNEPLVLRQQENRFEELLGKIGIEWQSYDWAQPGVMPLYLKIENPIDATKPFPKDLLAELEKMARRERRQGSLDDQWTKEMTMREWVDKIKDPEDEYWTTQIPAKALPVIKKYGYDGIKEMGMKGIPEAERQINWLAFDPTQIKTVFNTTFDPANPDIRYSTDKAKQYSTKLQEARPDFIREKFGKRQSSLREAATDVFDKIKTKEFWDTVTTKGVDRLHPIKTFLGEKAYRLHRIETGTQAVFSMLMEHSKLKWDASGFLTADERNSGFLPFLKRQGDDWGKFMYWVAAKRADFLDTEAGGFREHWLDKETRGKIFEWAGGENNPKWQKAAKELKAFNANILDIAEQAGLIDPNSRSVWEQEFYVPFYRIFEDEQAKAEFLKAPRKSKKFISAQIKKLKGAEKQLGDPLENLMHNWMHLINESMRNVARKEAFEFGVQSQSDIVERVGTKDIYSFRSSKDGKTTFAMKKTGENVLMFQDNGRPVYFKVNEPELFHALSNVNAQYLDNFIVKLMAKAKRWLTFGVTFGPGFMAANSIRDTMHTALVNKTFRPFMDTATGFVKAFREDQDFIALMASGAGFGSSYVRADDPATAAKYIERIIKKEGSSAKDRILNTPRKMLDFWGKVGSASENAARVQLYANLVKAGKSHSEAAFEARDLLDFTMKGDASAVQLLIQIVPFLNARMQGLYKLGKAVADQDNRKNFITRGAILSAATIALWMLHKDDDEYKELEDWDKWAYYHFWIGNKHFRIPKPFEVGAIFSSLPETLLDTLYGNDDTKHIANFIGHTARETFSIGLPQLFQPLLEQWSNKSTYTGRPIVGQHLQGLKAGEQSEPWTSETMQLAGELGISPKRAEALINGYFSTFGMFLLGGADIITRNLFDFPEQPAMRIDEYPLLGRFVKEKDARYTRYQTLLYDAFNEVDMLNRTIRHYQATGQYDKIKALSKEDLGKLRYKKVFNRTRRALSDINRQNRRIMRDRRLSPGEKRDRIDRLARKRNEIVKRVYTEANR